ncbi:hypothetical protein JCM8202v2_003818 [Rhodotorula sphaerocarpa]
MAEAIQEGGGPLADYLSEVNGTAAAPLQPAADSPAPTRRLSPSGSTSSPAPRPLIRRRTTTHRPHHYAAATERIKYALATSALLSANLRDALQLYPPLEQLALEEDPSVQTRSKGKGKERQGTITAEKTTQWPEGWEEAGLGFRDRSVLGNAAAALSALTRSLSSLSLGPAAALPSGAGHQQERAGDAASGDKRKQGVERPAQDAAIRAVQGFVAGAQELDLRIAAALGAIKELECIAHGLGLSDPLPPISRIEARAFAHLLSPPSPSASTSRGGPPLPDSAASASPAPSPPPLSRLRAIELRQALASALQEALLALERSTADLNALLPRDSPLLSLIPATTPSSPLPNLDADHESTGAGAEEEEGEGEKARGHEANKASIAELLRHDERARAERDELERFNNANGATSEGDALSGEARTPSPAAGVDSSPPPAATESTFGGIERRQLSSPAPASPSPNASHAQHRLRESLSSHAAANSSPLRRQRSNRDSTSSTATFAGEGPGTATPSRAGSIRRKRPVSLGGLSASASMRRSISAQSAASSPKEDPAAETDEGSSPRTGAPAADDPSPVPLLLVSLQETFDDVHALRRGVIWRLLEALTHAESDRAWNAISGLVGALAGRISDVAAQVRGAHESEFTGPVRSPGRGGLRGAARRKGRRSIALGGEGDSAYDRKKERRRRSGAFARELLDADEGDETPRGLPASPNLAGGEPSRRDVFAPRLSAAAGSTSLKTSSSSSLRADRRAPASYADFAPSASAISSSLLLRSSLRSSQGRNASELAQHAKETVLTLRAIEAKLQFVVDDLEAQSGKIGDARQVAAREMYGGIGADVKRVEEQWRNGRAALERAFGNAEPSAAAAGGDAASAGAPPLQQEKPTPAVPIHDIGIEHGEVDALKLGAEDAVLRTEPVGSDGEEDPIANRQALVDAALSLSLLPPGLSASEGAAGDDSPASTPLEEKVFEAIAGPARQNADGSKFSREERIRRMNEAREALARGRESLGSSPNKTRADSVEMGGGAAAQQKMVGELQEVLREYNRDRGRPLPVEPTQVPAPAQDDLTQRAPPLSVSIAAPPPPLPPTPPAFEAVSPPGLARPLLPPPPPPISTSLSPSSASPQQKALPQTPPRQATSPVSGLRNRPTPPPVRSPLSQKSTPAKRFSVHLAPHQLPYPAFGIASLSLGSCERHRLEDKIRAAAAAGFACLELFDLDWQQYCDEYARTHGYNLPCEEGDLASRAAAQALGDFCREEGIKITCWQPLRTFEGWIRPEDEVEARKYAKGILEVLPLLGTDSILCCTTSAPRSETTGSLEKAASDLAWLADLAATYSPPIKVMYEALSFATHRQRWQDAWEVVERADRPNLGICVDSFNTLAHDWADPYNPTGRLSETVDEELERNMAELVRCVPGDKIYLYQIADGRRMLPPMTPPDDPSVPRLRPWSRSHRLFPHEHALGAYLPVERFSDAVLATGYTGPWSLEVFNDSLKEPGEEVPQEHAERGMKGLSLAVAQAYERAHLKNCEYGFLIYVIHLGKSHKS